MKMRNGVAAAVVAAIACPAAASAMPIMPAAAPAKLTSSGVGQIKIGATYKSLRRKGLLGPQRPGCEADGPKARVAKLRGRATGSASLSKSTPRRVEFITLRGGAVANGVGFGDSKADVKAAFPDAEYITGAEKPFGITIVQVPESGGAFFQLGIDVKTKRVTRMGVPGIMFC